MLENRLEKTASTSAAATFMNKVYLWTVGGLLITAFTAYQTAQYLPILLLYLEYRPHGMQLFQYAFFTILGLQLLEVFVLSLTINKISETLAKSLYIFYAFTVGLSLSIIFIAYQKDYIYSTLFITAFAFLCLSAYGYYTKKDLSGFRTFCLMSLFGLIGFEFYHVIFPATLTDLSQKTDVILGILIFSGLTAADTQKIKNLANTMDNKNVEEPQAQKAAIIGALMLYLDFVNLFLKLLARRKR